MNLSTAITEDRIDKQRTYGLLPALLLAAGYYCGAKIGFVLPFEPAPVAVFWPPNAILLAGLLMTPHRGWWLVLAAILPAHLATQFDSGVPLATVLGWYASNCGEAILAAACARGVLGQGLRFESFHRVITFLFYCVFLTPFAFSFVDIALARMLDWRAGGFWQLWQLRFFSNAVAMLAAVPALLAWNAGAFPATRKPSFLRQLESGLLAFALLGLSGVVVIFGLRLTGAVALLLYAALPVLLWAAVRFDPSIRKDPGRALSDVLKSAVAGPNKAVDKAVEAERMSEARFSKVFRLSPDAMCISIGIQGRILDVNDRWQMLFGYRRPEAIGNTARHLKLFASEKDLAAVLDRHRKDGYVRDLEVKMQNREGRILHTVLSGGEIDIGDEGCFITILRDVTQQRRAESEAQQQREQLTHLTRVVVLGELSGALAHELNQPLAAILANAQAARRFMNHQPVDLREIREILDDIVDEGKRAGEVIRRLRALFMKGEPQMQPLDINELVRDALELTHSGLIERKVPVVLQLGSGLGVVQGDRVQLQQVLLNLIVNACEAMSASAAETRQLKLVTDADAEGNVRIAMADTGPGIDPDAIDRVFEPFFTTKAQGLGFGLSISRAIIAEHGGRIDAVNNPDGGATFRITLPVRAGAAS